MQRFKVLGRQSRSDLQGKAVLGDSKSLVGYRRGSMVSMVHEPGGDTLPKVGVRSLMWLR